MADLLRINLHCHSNLSDGQLTPEQLAARLAQDRVRFAALTDHNTVEGLARFREAATREGIGVISGVELSAESSQGEVHLLAYGFDPDSTELRRALSAANRSDPAPAELGAPQAHGLPVDTIVQLVHQAGGKVFLAHPFNPPRTPGEVEALLQSMQAAGLDGLEAVYAPYDREQIQSLIELARARGLLVCGGSDFHGPDTPNLAALGVDMPREHWVRFRESLFSAAGAHSVSLKPDSVPSQNKPAHLDWTGFFFRILLPTLLVMGLLVVPVLTFVVPAFEDALLSRKREMIRELTRSAASILAEYHEDEKLGRVEREEAQKAAASRIEFLRYGKEGKDYFWITDMHPRMVMHPYRTDLNGKDVSAFRDPKGNLVFMEFLRVVRDKREGYVEYVWQWKDDATRLAPKQSYVLRFEPWGWVIGTGIYIEDVRAEIATLTQRIVRISAAIGLVIALLLLFVAQQSLRLERQRRRAEDALRESHERYRALVEASKEGTMLVAGGRPSYANQTLLGLLGYAEGELALLELRDLFLDGPGLPDPAGWVEAAVQQGEAPTPAEARLLTKGGKTIDVLLSVEPMTLAGRPGCIVMTKDLSTHKGLLAALDARRSVLSRLAESMSAALLRTSLDRRMRVVEANPAAFALLALRRDGEEIEPGLAELFTSAKQFDAFRRELIGSGQVRGCVERLAGTSSARTVSLSAVLLHDERGDASGCELIAEPLGDPRVNASDRDGLIADLQAPLLSLSEPVGRFARALPTCDPATRIEDAAALMAQHQASALLVAGPGGESLGLVTDSDFRARVVGRGIPVTLPVHEIMSAPVIHTPRASPSYQALLLMQKNHLQHLVVRNESGEVEGVVRSRDLLDLDRYPLAVLSREIHSTARLEDVLRLRAKLPPLVKALVDAGAKPRNVAGAISAVTDAVTQRLVRLATEELGPAPAPFAFLALGSQGRCEETLGSDQDNALVFEVPAGLEQEAVQPYFLAMGERVCRWLARAGYALCKGGAMASSPRFCVPLARWKELFSEWIHVAEPQALLEFNVFFDLRCAYGKGELAAALREHVMTELARTPSFFVHLAQNALHNKPLLGFFGNIVAESDERGSAKSFNIKEALTPIVSFTRLYALRAGIPDASTFDRLKRLGQQGVLGPKLYEDIGLAYELLMSLRLRHQAEAIRTGLSPNNQITIESLGRIEESLLKQIFSEVTGLQRRIATDFLGGAWTQSG